MIWDNPPLGSLVEAIVPARDKPEQLDGPIPWVRIEDFDGKYISGSKSGQGVTLATIRSMPLRIFPSGTVVCTCSCSMGITAIVEQPIVTNQTFIGLKPRDDRLLPEFLYYALQAHRDRLTANATGAIQTYLSKNDFTTLRIAVPPVAEQRAIADYLDRETARIDALVAAKKRMSRTLSERFEAVLEEAMPTAGGTRRVRFLATKIGSGKTPPGGAEVYRSEGVPFLRSQNVLNGSLDLTDVVFISPEMDAEMANTRIKGGDVLLNITGGSIGRCAVVSEAVVGGNLNQHVCIVRPHETTVGPLLHYAFRSCFVQEQIRELQVGGNRDGLNFEQVGNLRVAIPSTMRDQVLLTEHIAEIEAEHQSIANSITEQVALLYQRREALVSAAVIGQIEVQVAA